MMRNELKLLLTGITSLTDYKFTDRHEDAFIEFVEPIPYQWSVDFIERSHKTGHKVNFWMVVDACKDLILANPAIKCDLCDLRGFVIMRKDKYNYNFRCTCKVGKLTYPRSQFYSPVLLSDGYIRVKYSVDFSEPVLITS